MTEDQQPIPFHEQLRLQKLGLAEKTTGPKPKKSIPKVSKKRAAQLKAAKDENGDTELVRFYKSAMKRMTGHCLNCHAKTETHIYSAAIFSICHILDKRETMCPSVRDHLCNWIELCPDCHREFDTPPFEKDKTLWDKREEMGIWEAVRDRLVMVWPDLAPEERRHFPESVIKYMEKHEPF